MAASPPQAATPGQPYILSMTFTSYAGGAPVDPAGVQLDITAGGQAGLVPDTAGPYYYAGASSPGSGVVWRTGTGQYSFWWAVPAGISSGEYTANWTCTYSGDDFLVLENFPVTAGFTPVASADTGYWTGTIAYEPSWSPAPLTIPLGGVDDLGVAWLLQSVTGWDSPPTAVGSVIQRAGDHGGWPVAQFYGPRLITLTVWASAPTQALRDQARANLQQAVPPGITASDLAVFTYQEPTPKVAYVRRNATATIAETYPTLTDVIFTIPLVAPDPRKYSAAVQTASTATQTVSLPLAITVTPPWSLPQVFPNEVAANQQGILAVNAGTFETRPVVTVTGPVTSPSIINGATGQAVTFTGLVVGSGHQLVLNMDARQAFYNGAFYPADSASAWWVLNPGTSTVFMTGSNSAGSTLSMTWSSAWV